ncbi:AaceriAGL275Wp [[Ashbya] aceris (nom. inval.)]|nr:AaceriAGL275Wp [[Ashbya] aceris (nom. inval.)]
MATHSTYDDDDQGIFMNKSMMLANFEEWIKMATDNKINSRNSWNFALIDYFHDLNVLKDAEDNINFQKASATLDGCVKIYSSRVDSVANETGKLLSGLAERRSKEAMEGAESGAGAEEEEGDVEIDPVSGMPIARDMLDVGKRRRNYNRVLETTLVEFSAIKAKELEQELHIDPLFKKTLAAFDEGGAKSLLLNTLNADNDLRVVFDATSADTEGARPSDSAGALVEEGGEPEEPSWTEEHESQDSEASERSEISARPDDEEMVDAEATSICPSDAPLAAELSVISETDSVSSFVIEDEILALGIQFLNFEHINAAELCPSMSQLKAAVQDGDHAKIFMDGNHKFDNFLTEEDMQEAIPASGDYADGDDFGYQLPGQDDEESYNASNDDMQHGDLLNPEDAPANLVASVMDQDLLAYFDDVFTKSWRGREHWKVHNYKSKLMKHKEKLSLDPKQRTDSAASNSDDKEPRKKAKKDNAVDFFDLDSSIEETIFAASKTSIELPEKHREDPSHYLLPDDYHFSAAKVTRLFIKPKQHMSFFAKRKRPSVAAAPLPPPAGPAAPTEPPQLADENFWADKYKENEQIHSEPQDTSPDAGTAADPTVSDDECVDFNQAFDVDDGLDDDGLDDHDAVALTQLAKPDDKVPYSRTAKKVDVRRLKNNLWKALSARLAAEKTQLDPAAPRPLCVKFTDLAADIAAMYSDKTRKDLSTSFCFICLLHLANEHGFSISHRDRYDDLDILFDLEAAA